MPSLQYSREVPVRSSVDVFVAGGGPAGIAAAIAAARQGASVFLAEGHTCFGGMGTAGMVPAMMMFADGVNFVADGIGREVWDKILAVQGLPADHNSAYKTVNIWTEGLKRIYDEMILDSGIDFSFQTQVISIEKTTPKKLSHAVCSAKSGLFAIEAKVFVDCTGDGDLAVWAGAPYEKGDADGNLMAGTLCSLWADIDWEGMPQQNAREKLPQAIEDGVFSKPDLHLPGIGPVGKRLGGGNIGHVYDLDGTDERSLTRGLIWGRKTMPEYERYYKEYLKGFEKMQLAATGSLLGVRETRRIMGDYVLNLDDFKSRAVFDDEIGRYSYPVDIHASDASAKSYAQFEKEYTTLRYEAGENYGIPYRTLVTKGLDNLLVAGRCISSDRYIQSSIRVMPGCFITGQAAGIAAAMAAHGNTDTRGIQVKELQRRLASMGAYLPNI